MVHIGDSSTDSKLPEGVRGKQRLDQTNFFSVD